MILECDTFTVSHEGGKIRLQIEGASKIEAGPETSYEAEKAMNRLSELLGRKVSRGNLAYWREHMGLPYRKLGLKKFVYLERDLVRWSKGRSLIA